MIQRTIHYTMTLYYIMCYHIFILYTTEFGEAVVTYEQVVKIEPQLERPRPIMLVAPRGGPFNMEELSDNLVRDSPQRFGAPIPRKDQNMRAERQYADVYTTQAFSLYAIWKCINRTQQLL